MKTRFFVSPIGKGIDQDLCEFLQIGETSDKVSTNVQVSFQNRTTVKMNLIEVSKENLSFLENSNNERFHYFVLTQKTQGGPIVVDAERSRAVPTSSR
jgi:hypothetical protein